MTAESAHTDGPTREVLASVEGLRVQLVTLAPDQRIPWHRHTVAADTVIAIVGPVTVETRAEARSLLPGERVVIPAGTEHTVHGRDGAGCRFLNLHAGGAYDFVATS